MLSMVDMIWMRPPGQKYNHSVVAITKIRTIQMGHKPVKFNGIKVNYQPVMWHDASDIGHYMTGSSGNKLLLKKNSIERFSQTVSWCISTSNPVCPSLSHSGAKYVHCLLEEISSLFLASYFFLCCSEVIISLLKLIDQFSIKFGHSWSPGEGT